MDSERCPSQVNKPGDSYKDLGREEEEAWQPAAPVSTRAPIVLGLGGGSPGLKDLSEVK